MDSQKDRFGETIRLVERAKEDIFFAKRDRELLEKFRGQLRKVNKVETLRCVRCPGKLETYMFRGIALDRCVSAAAFGWTKVSWKRLSGKLTVGLWVNGLTNWQRETSELSMRSCDGNYS